MRAKGGAEAGKLGFSFSVVEQQCRKEREAGVEVAVRRSGKLKSRRVGRRRGGDFIAGTQSGEGKKRGWRVPPNLAGEAGALRY
jgi:hypothetical protein